MNSDHTIKSIINLFKDELITIYPQREIEGISYILLEHLLNYSKIEIQLNRDEKIEQNIFKQITSALARLKSRFQYTMLLVKQSFMI